MILPILSVLVLFLFFLKEDNIAIAFIKSILVAAVSVSFSTEILGMFKILNRTSLYIFWFELLAISIFIWYKSGIDIKLLKDKFKIQKTSGVDWLFIAGIGIVLITTAITAIFSTPNNWDSMVYHLARIPNWMQQQSVDHFATHITRQIAFSPLSEYAMLHTKLLSGSDNWFNLVQWISLFCSTLAIYEITKQLQINRTVALTAVIIGITIPMGILQSSSTQNDYLTGFFVLSTVLFILKFHHQNKSINIIWIAISAGLALFTKGTAFIYLFPLAIWFVVIFIKRANKISLKFGLVGLLIIVSVNLNHWLRNVEVFSNPLGDQTNTMSYFAPKALASNLIRNSAMELTSQTELLNEILRKISYKTHQFIGIDQNDKRTTWAGSQHFELRPYLSHEDYASNPIHFLLFIIGVIFILTSLIKSNNSIVFYAMAVLVTYLLFCFLLEWQIWHNRLHLPILLLSAPISAYLLSKFKYVNVALAILLLVLAVYIGLNNETRPIVGSKSIFKTNEIDQVFIKRTDQKNHWLAIADFCKSNNCSKIGFIGNNSGWEYPLWKIVNPKFDKTIQNILVENKSNKLETKNFLPSIIIVQRKKMGTEFQYHQNLYSKVLSLGEISLYQVKM